MPSCGTPSKKDRVERHLMRQRGAGIRSIASNFGFIFTANTQHTPEARSSEPYAKRRKTEGEDGQFKANITTTTPSVAIKGSRGLRPGLEYSKLQKEVSSNCARSILQQQSGKTIAGREKTGAKDSDAGITTKFEDGSDDVRDDKVENKAVVKLEQKKRGRPRKAAAVKTASFENEDGATGKKPPRKRGRPRKATPMDSIPSESCAKAQVLDMQVLQEATTTQSKAVGEREPNLSNQELEDKILKPGRKRKANIVECEEINEPAPVHGAVIKSARKPKRKTLAVLPDEEDELSLEGCQLQPEVEAVAKAVPQPKKRTTSKQTRASAEDKEAVKAKQGRKPEVTAMKEDLMPTAPTLVQAVVQLSSTDEDLTLKGKTKLKTQARQPLAETDVNTSLSPHKDAQQAELPRLSESGRPSRSHTNLRVTSDGTVSTAGIKSSAVEHLQQKHGTASSPDMGTLVKQHRKHPLDKTEKLEHNQQAKENATRHESACVHVTLPSSAVQTRNVPSRLFAKSREKARTSKTKHGASSTIMIVPQVAKKEKRKNILGMPDVELDDLFAQVKCVLPSGVKE